MWFRQINKRWAIVTVAFFAIGVGIAFATEPKQKVTDVPQAPVMEIVPPTPKPEAPKPQPPTRAPQPAKPAPSAPAPKAAPKPVPAPAPKPVVRSYPNTYPSKYADAPMDTIVDPWHMYNRECVSYVAFKNMQAGRSFPSAMRGADANEWPAKASAAGLVVSSQPKLYSAAVRPSGAHGHVAWVERINGDGTIDVTQYNKRGAGEFSYETVSASSFSSYVYFN